MERRVALFMVLAVGILMLNLLLSLWTAPKRPPAIPQAKAGAGQEGDLAARGPRPPEPPADADRLEPEEPAPQAAQDQPAQPRFERQWSTIGSVDPTDANPYRMLVTFTNEGAAIKRIEMSRSRYLDVEFWNGYLGHLELRRADDGEGFVVGVVGPGTPAAEAGLKAGDVLQALNGTPLKSVAEFDEALARTEPGDAAKLSIDRAGAALDLTATLRRRPLGVIRPEVENLAARREEPPPGFHDPPSFLLDLAEVGAKKFAPGALVSGIDLRRDPWEVAASGPDFILFRQPLVEVGLEIYKYYRLAQAPAESRDDVDFNAYHLDFDVAIVNKQATPTPVVYRLDGPAGLPIEGWWYAHKISRGPGTPPGIRDLVGQWLDQAPVMYGATSAADEAIPTMRDQAIMFLAMDAQYFATALIPLAPRLEDIRFNETVGLRLSPPPLPATNKTLTNFTFRITSTAATLPAGKSEPVTAERLAAQPADKVLDFIPDEMIHDRFQIFSGPKRPPLLAKYGRQANPPAPAHDAPPAPVGEDAIVAPLSSLVYYGWQIWAMFAIPLRGTLHVFYDLIPNYGIAIILLTVLVRSCLFPLSRKQAASMARMQALQPEMQKIKEKYKGDMEKQSKATQDLFRKHRVNPMGGCLLAFLQLPIFLGLYRALMVDIELRQAPLFGNSVRWCSNLAAPDMLFDWTGFMPTFMTRAQGFLSLGPYFNVLPVIVIILYLLQQKMFMPPAVDEQQIMQQKMMKYMMVFIGFMFYTVPAGLCLYFIASTLWSIGERKLIPPPQAPSLTAGEGSESAAVATLASNGSRNKNKKKKR